MFGFHFHRFRNYELVHTTTYSNSGTYDYTELTYIGTCEVCGLPDKKKVTHD